MKTYDFGAEEFSKLLWLLTALVHFHHQPRSEAELQRFSAEIYPLLNEVQYRIAGAKLSDVQREAISSDDPWPPDGPDLQDAIAKLTTILS